MTEALSEALSDVVSDANGEEEDSATATEDGPATNVVASVDVDVATGDCSLQCACTDSAKQRTQ